MRIVRQERMGLDVRMVIVDDISAVDRLFQGLLCSVWRVNFKLNRQKYLTTQIGKAEEMILRIVDIRSTLLTPAQATLKMKKINGLKGLGRIRKGEMNQNGGLQCTMCATKKRCDKRPTAYRSALL